MPPKKTPAPADAPPAGGGTEPRFEESLERLETIVEQLEGGQLSLEDAIARYEEGVKLSRRLSQTLDEAEKRIERLEEAAEAGGTPTTRPDDLEPDAPGDGRRGPAGGGPDELPF